MDLYELISLSHSLIKKKDDRLIFIFSRLLEDIYFEVRIISAKILISYQKINNKALDSLVLLKPYVEILGEIDLMLTLDPNTLTVGVILYITKCLNGNILCYNYANALIDTISNLIYEDKIILCETFKEEIFSSLEAYNNNIVRNRCLEKLIV